jgi:hypothetical protein
MRSRSRLCNASSSTGWRDSNRFLRIMAITIRKLNIPRFSFSHLHSGTEMLHLSGTCHIWFWQSWSDKEEFEKNE